MSTFSLSSSFKDKIRFKRVEEQTAKEKVKIRSGGGEINCVMTKYTETSLSGDCECDSAST